MSKFADNYDNKHALAFFSIFVSMLLIILEYFLFTKVKYYGLLLLIALLFLAISVGKKNINKWLYYYFTQVKHEPEATDMPLLVKMRKLAETYYNKYDFMFLSILAIVVAIVIYFLSQWSITTILVFIILLVLAIRISFKMERMKIQWLLKYFTRSMYDPEKIEKELLKNNDYGLNTNRYNDKNIVIYSGFNPFIGIGNNLGGWSFAVDMTKPKYETTEVENFPMSKVYQHLDMVINELKIPGMKIDNCLFTHGSDIKNEKWILSDKFAKPNQW